MFDFLMALLEKPALFALATVLVWTFVLSSAAVLLHSKVTYNHGETSVVVTARDEG